MNEILNYEEMVYAGVLGKVIGVYMGRPFEGWDKHSLVSRWGLIDHYVADDQDMPLVVADDDITGTFTFIRALEDTGKYADTLIEEFGDMWLNYIVEGKSILWWGGLGHSTEHTAYCRLKDGIKAPLSGCISSNGQIVAEQIGSQIFIDAFGMVAPGNPQLAAKMAMKSASVSHDGEAIYGAQVVAAMVSAAFIEKEMDAILDAGVSVIPETCLISQVHYDVRKWCKEDGNWHVTYEKIKEKYGYQIYGGNCHIIPNHAIMVMAWCYAPNSFRMSQAIINTAGWDTDCNAANVGSVMGVKVGLEGINSEYDFQTPMADRIILPTAEGSRHVSDCLLESGYIARIGRKIMGWDPIITPKDGAWHHFSQQGSQHGYMVENSCDKVKGTAELNNIINNDTRMLEIKFYEATSNHPVRVSTPIIHTQRFGGYGVMGTPRIYNGYSVYADIICGNVTDGSTISLFARSIDTDTLDNICNKIKIQNGKIISLENGKTITLEIDIKSLEGRPITDLGFEISGKSNGHGTIYIDRVYYDINPEIEVSGSLAKNEFNEIAGWINDIDMSRGKFSDDSEDFFYIGKNSTRGVLVTGTNEWSDYTISADIKVHCPGKAGLIARYRGLTRFYALYSTTSGFDLICKNDNEEYILGQYICDIKIDSTFEASLSVEEDTIIAKLNNKIIIEAKDYTHPSGGAGFLVEKAMFGFKNLIIE